MLTKNTIVLAASAAIASTSLASDPVFTLEDRNSSASFDVNSGQISW